MEKTKKEIKEEIDLSFLFEGFTTLRYSSLLFVILHYSSLFFTTLRYEQIARRQ
jgi:hypothetical protein